MTNYHLTIASKEDLNAIVVLGEIFWEETSYNNLTYSHENVRRLVSNAIADDKHIVNLAWQDTELVGLFIGFVDNKLSVENVGELFCIYVKPEHRDSGIAFKLCQAFFDHCYKYNCMRIDVTCETSINDESFERLWTSFGFEKSGIMLRR